MPKIVVALLILALHDLALPALAEPVGVPLVAAVPHMTTTGEAFAEVVPDGAEVTLGVKLERKTPDEATMATAAAATTVLEAIKAHGIGAADIRTRFTLAATFDAHKDEKGNEVSRTLRGYEADETIVVRLHDTAVVGPLVRDLVAKGANTLPDVDYSFSKERQKRLDLRAEALRDALQQARSSADAIGLKLGRVLQVGDDPAQVAGWADLPSRRAPPSGRSGPVVPLEPGLKRLVETATVIWEIEGRAR